MEYDAHRLDNVLLVTGAFIFSQPVEVGGARLAYMATAVDAEVPSGSYFSAPSATSKAASRADGFEDAKVSAEALDDELAARLWDASSRVVGL